MNLPGDAGIRLAGICYDKPDCRQESGAARRRGARAVWRRWSTPVFLSLIASTALAQSPFRFADVNENSLGLWEGEKPVLVYNHGVISKEGVPADRARSTYLHPIYGLDGEVLTDDFPADHYHHRGLFWAWPHVRIDGQHYDLWMLRGVRQQFERWLGQSADATSATLHLENGWYVGERKVMREEVKLRVGKATGDERAIDVELKWVPLERAVTLQGAEGKSYGGLTLRFAPHQNPVITVPSGRTTQDLTIARLPWADFSAGFAGAQQTSGAAIFIHPSHPDFPPEWLTRHYGVLCLGWPGVEAQTFAPGQVMQARYRVWVHRGTPEVEVIEQAYRDYASSASLRAELQGDRVRVSIAEKPFTDYLFRDDEKYPYFYPVNAPRTGRTVTERRQEAFPHHSSLFFGCDKVNGGNYWQEGLERGRIVSKSVRLLRDSGSEIVLEQDCRWERPGAEAPFDDRRVIRITAPSPDRRYIDFDITLTARIKVRIEKNNHSLFSARMAPELSVKGGGTLVNAAGAQGEQATFAQPSPWMDARGPRDGVTEGLAILCHPSNRWFPTPWFTRDYGFFSPTPMQWLEGGALEFAPGETLRLRYRVIVHAGDPGPAELEAEFQAWSR